MNYLSSPRVRYSRTVLIAALGTAYLLAFAQNLLAEPKGDENVKSLQLLEIPGTAGASRARAAVAAGDTLYLAGDTWTKETGKDVWLWRVDRAGKKLWEKRLGHPDKKREDEALIGLLGDAQGPWHSAGGPRAVLARKGETLLVSFKPNGDISRETTIGKIEDTLGVVSLENNDMLLFGTSTTTLGKDLHAWVARIDPWGTVLWKGNFDPLAEEKDIPQAAELRPRALRGSHLYAAAVLADGSAVLVGQTGAFNKFGLGPSKLWLLRLDGNGQKLAEAFVESGRTLPTGRDMLSACEDGVLVPYTTSQLPPIAGAPFNFPPSFDARMARYDAKLQKLWDKPAPPSFMPGAVTINGPRPFISVAAGAGDVLIRSVDPEGNELSRAHVTTPNSSVLPVATLRIGGDAVIVCNCMPHGKPGAKESEQVMLVTVDASPRQAD